MESIHRREQMVALSTPVAVQRLSQLREELREIPNKDAFNNARMLNPDAVDNETFRLLFLRAGNLDSKVAARRLVEHFQQKVDLFGIDKLTSRIGPAHLNANDLQALSSKAFELFHSKDSKGPSVLVLNYGKMNANANKSMLRAFWYMLVSALENQQVQEYGMKLVVFNIDKDGNYYPSTSLDPAMRKELARCTFSVPVRIVSIHHCSGIETEQDLLTEQLAKQSGIEAEVHRGSYYDCVTQLVTKGIPNTVFLSESEGKTEEGSMLAGLTAPGRPATMGGVDLSTLSKVQGPLGSQEGFPAGNRPFGLDEQDLLLARLKSLQSFDIQPRRAFPPMGSATTTTPQDVVGGLGQQDVLADNTGSSQVLDQAAHSSGVARLPPTSNTMTNQGSSGLPFFDYGSSPHQQGLSALGVTHGSQMMMGGMQAHQDLAQLQNAFASSGNTSGLSQALSHALQNNLAASMTPVGAAAIDSQLHGTTNADLASLFGAVHQRPQAPTDAAGGSSANYRALQDQVDRAQQMPSQGSLQASMQGGVGPFHSRRDELSSLQQYGQTTLQDGSSDLRGQRTNQPRNSPQVHHPPICLYTERDSEKISSYQCVARQQIELFEANEDDVQFNTSKMNKAIVVGQVGIRCRHCASLPQYSRPKAAVYYPRTLHSLYQFGQNMIKNHLSASCRLIPDETKKSMEGLREERRRGRGGREHWAAAASALGICEDSYGLRFGGSS